MHNKNEAVYENFYDDMLKETQECVDIAKAAGVADDKIMVNRVLALERRMR